MPQTAAPLVLTVEDRAELVRWSQGSLPMLAERARIVLACAEPESGTSALSRRSSPIAASYSPTAARWAEVSPGAAFHLPALVLEQHEIISLVLVHTDDPGHSGVIEPARLGQGRLQQAKLSGGDLDTLADVPG